MNQSEKGGNKKRKEKVGKSRITKENTKDDLKK